VKGYNPMDRFEYSNGREANEIIESFGSLEGAITHTLGEPTGEIADGNVVLYELTDGSQAAGVIYLGRGVVRTKNGITDLPVDMAKAVWSS
jgi:hypothetical protein